MIDPRPSAAEARAEAQAAAKARAAQRRVELAAHFEGAERAGQAIVAASWVGAAAFTLTAIAGAVVPAAVGAAFVVALALFAVGTVGFLAALFAAARRSRTHAIGVGALVSLSGTAPSVIRLKLFVPLGLEVIVAVSTAAARPYSTLAFGTLAPMFGVGCVALWSARHGAFSPRQ